ncbi:nitroreductase [Mycobacterium sp. E802]|uniref:nitroreductase family protein n=1 Tax=Mycobacterium sp. E802 TaxID=1834152 RepID=UPI0007FFA91A|nr:nitroreductase family protein [Mycobacterium sp. E802]OBG88791.1 nitroreductase [Mycobacterium sp. E802]
MTLMLSADELLTTTRSVRKRLDPDKPVPREVLVECLELAVQAPSGSNLQGWQWMFVEDTAKKKALADIYRAAFDNYLQLPRLEFEQGDNRGDRMDRIVDSSTYLADHFHEVPVIMVPCIQGRVETAPEMGASFWGSLLPAVWSYQLALRSRGLGSAYTTMHLFGDGERQAAEVLGIPFAEYSQAGMFPIAYTTGTEFRPAKRLPFEQIMHWDQW